MTKSESELRTWAMLLLLGTTALVYLGESRSGLAAVAANLGLIFGVFVVGAFASVVILFCRFSAKKKFGLMFILAALLVGWIWFSLRAPREWPEELATVIAINGPPVMTDTDFTYEANLNLRGALFTVTQTKSWADLAAATRYQPLPTFVYFDRTNPREARFESVPGWMRVSARPEAAPRIRAEGAPTATLRIGQRRSMTATFTDPNVARYQVGNVLRVWINPITWSEVSLLPRETEGGQKFWLLGLSGILGVVGVGVLSSRGVWADPLVVSPPRGTSPPTVAAAPSPPTLSIAERLRMIDWFQFEAVSARILEANGWSVDRSGGANPDGGADLLATRAGRKAVVQCKHWRRVEVQPKIIRELIGTRSSARFAADDAMLFTLSDCTEAALACARDNRVDVYPAARIENEISRIGLARFPELLNPEKKFCPKCGSPLVYRDKAETPFWGCSTYPRCRGKIEVSS